MLIRIILPLALAGFAAACARTATESDRTVDPGTAMAASQIPADPAGKAVFDAVCAECHSLEPPAKLAPPMSHVARHYRSELGGDDKAGLARIAAWIRQPAAERSLLPAHAIERWGVMPPVTLSADQIEAVAGYVWSLDRGVGMRGMGQGQPMMMRHGEAGTGQGMMMHGGRGGMGQDTVRHRGHGGMGQAQGGTGQGMMMHGGRGGMGAGEGVMGGLCRMRSMQPDTSSAPTG